MSIDALRPYVAESDGRPRILSARKFLGDLRPIETIVDDLPMPRGGLVSITGLTGSGKTTLCTALQVALRMSLPFAGRDVVAGSVLVLAGENPEDYGMHLCATLRHHGIDRQQLTDLGANRHLMIVPGVFSIDTHFDFLLETVAGQCNDLVAVFVDTSAAYFSEADENDNVQMRRHASLLRELTQLPGRPTVFVLCHPTKSATKDSLLPRGGGAFLNEVDANLTVWKADDVVTLHWAGKIRGSNFDPVKFELLSQELPEHLDRHGRPLVSTVVRHIPDERAEQIEAKVVDDEDRLLIQMQKKPGASVRELAMACGWTNGTGKPLATRADRRLRALEGLGLAERDRKGKWRLTPKGQKEADRLP